MPNFISTLNNVNQATAPPALSQEKSKPKSMTLKRGKKKIYNRNRCSHRLYRQSVLFAVLSILVALSVSLPTQSFPKAPTSLALESPQTKPSHERGLNTVDMKIDSPTQSNDDHSRSEQGEENGDSVRAPTSKLPSVKGSWRQVKNDLQMNGTSFNLSPQGTGPAEPDPPDENLHQPAST